MKMRAWMAQFGVCVLAGSLAACNSAEGVTMMNPVPILDAIGPRYAQQGGSGFTMNVSGSGFVPSSVVQWNGSNRTTTFISNTRLTASITAADIAAVGTAEVTVVNPAPGGGTSGIIYFTIYNLRITTLTPSSATAGGPAFTLTVEGSGFRPRSNDPVVPDPGSRVEWNGSLRSTSFVSSTRLTASITTADIAAPGTVSVRVVDSRQGVASNTVLFTINAASPSAFESRANVRSEACSVPAARGYSRMVYDAKSGKVFLFSGYSTFSFDQMDVLDVWAFDTEEKTWRLVGPFDAHDFDALAFDAKSRKVIFYNTFVFTADGGCCDVATWAYDVDTGEWENRRPSVQPPARWGSRMAYDSESDRVILYGGSDLYTTEILGDTWSYDYETNTWTELHPPASPQPIHFPDVVYVPTIDRVVLFGGLGGGPFPTYVELNETWAYDFNSNAWINVRPAHSPTWRVYHALAFEEQTNRIVMFGGTLDESTWPNQTTIDETWIYSVAENDWLQANPDKVTATARAWHQMVGTGNGVVLFGGGPSRFAYNAETYIYRSRPNKWKLITCDDDD